MTTTSSSSSSPWPSARWNKMQAHTYISLCMDTDMDTRSGHTSRRTVAGDRVGRCRSIVTSSQTFANLSRKTHTDGSATQNRPRLWHPASLALVAVLSGLRHQPMPAFGTFADLHADAVRHLSHVTPPCQYWIDGSSCSDGGGSLTAAQVTWISLGVVAGLAAVMAAAYVARHTCLKRFFAAQANPASPRNMQVEF